MTTALTGALVPGTNCPPVGADRTQFVGAIPTHAVALAANNRQLPHRFRGALATTRAGVAPETLCADRISFSRRDATCRVGMAPANARSRLVT